MDDESGESCLSDCSVVDFTEESNSDVRSDTSTCDRDDSSVDESFSSPRRQQQNNDEDEDEYSTQLRSCTTSIVMDDESGESCLSDCSVVDFTEESNSDVRSDTSTCDRDDSSVDESFSSPRRQQQNNDEDEDEYSTQLRSWTGKVPIGLGLCPWAIKSRKLGRIKYRTCQGCLPSDVMELILSEAKALCNDAQPPLSTTLIICPQVADWRNNFHLFDEFVRNARSWSNGGQCLTAANGDDNISPHQFDLLQEVTLVAFHPLFLRWRGLPSGIGIGSVVQSPKNLGIFQRSPEIYSATVLETSNKMFGQRKIRVRFHDDMKEQYVPVNWLVADTAPPSPPPSEPSGGSSGDNGHTDVDLGVGPVLPDNIMHRAPYPTIHLIRNVDLGKMCIRDISRVKRKNAQRMMRLGWDGVLRNTSGDY